MGRAQHERDMHGCGRRRLPTTVECATEGSTEPGSVAVGAGTSARVVDAVASGAAEASTASAAAGTTSFTNGRKSGSNQSAGTAG